MRTLNKCGLILCYSLLDGTLYNHMWDSSKMLVDWHEVTRSKLLSLPLVYCVFSVTKNYITAIGKHATPVDTLMSQVK